MTDPRPNRQKTGDFASLRAWREAASPRGGRVAVVTGTFDILQPGNLFAIQEAARAALSVCVILEPDAAVSERAGKGRPHHSLQERAEFVSCLKDVALVTSAEPGAAKHSLARLRPFVWITCPELAGSDAFATAAVAAADEIIEIPRLAGCSTAEIHEAMRADRTPIAVELPPDMRWNDAPRTGDSDPAASALAATPKKSLVTVNGCFDILHTGHLRFLAQAAAMGDELTVLLNSDGSVSRYKGPTRPVFPSSFRRAALLALGPVAGVDVFEEDKPLSRIAAIRPAVHVKGGSYEPERVREEQELMESWGGRLVFCPMVDDRSTSGYIRKVLAP